MNNYPLIMAVDDEPVVLMILKRTLEKSCFNVITANDGTSALALMNLYPPDLVLLDINMPGLNGFEVLDALRQHSDVPVIMLTARIDQESLISTLKTGADDFIRKPFATPVLLARIQAKLRRSQPQNHSMIFC